MPRVNNPGRLFWASSFNALRVPSNPGPEGNVERAELNERAIPPDQGG